MEQIAEWTWGVEAERESLRQSIEMKRRKLDSKVRGRADLLRCQELSRELDHLIVQYLDMEVGGSSSG